MEFTVPTPTRGWKSRRDAAVKNAKREAERAEIRRLRAGLVDSAYVAPLEPEPVIEPTPVVDTIHVVEVAPAPAPKGKAKKEKAPLILDGEYLVEED